MGSRGTGKTTCAKILAREVNGVAFDTDSIDIQEIDAASNNSVDDIRALREEAGYLPSELKYKVYIIDEVHMLTNAAFNALLKTLEEPPPHVIFILATTEIHKVPATILSRCQRFEFHRINAEESAKTLIEIAKKENITLHEDAAMLISRLSDGGMRDALSLLDVCVSENSTITQEVVRDCAGIAGKEHLFAITDAIAGGDGKTALSIIAELYGRSKDPARLIDELLQHFRNLMIIKLMPENPSLLTALTEEIPDYQKQATLFSINEIIDALDKLEDCLRIKGRKVETEICLMRMCLSFGSGEKKETTSQPKPAPIPKSTPAPPPQPVPVYEPPAPIPPPPPPPTATAVAASPPPAPEIKHENVSGFSEWEKITLKLSAYQASMLEEASAGISGNTIVVSGGGVLEYFFDNHDNTSAIERAAREVTGKDYKVVFDRVERSQSSGSSSESTETKVTKVNQFLEDAKSSGIQVTIN
jgi:DNA polymerase-3 subunit gamma/tau